jgi:hypothetical protein
MIGKKKEVYIVNPAEIAEVFEIEEYEVLDLLSDTQNYGSDCYVNVYIGVDSIVEDQRRWVETHDMSDDEREYYRLQIRIVDWLRENVPSEFDNILLEVEY